MIRHLDKMISLADLKYLPVYVYEDMPPQRVIRAFESTVKLYERLGLEDKFFRKIRLVYIKPGVMKAAWFFISDDRKLVEVDKLLTVNRAQELIDWYNEHMNKYILKIIPEDEVKSIPLPMTEKLDDELREVTLTQYKRILKEAGIPDHLLNKVKITKAVKTNVKKFLKYRKFFYVDGKIVYVDTQDCITEAEMQKRIKDVKDWWMLQKLQDI